MSAVRQSQRKGRNSKATAKASVKRDPEPHEEEEDNEEDVPRASKRSKRSTAMADARRKTQPDAERPSQPEEQQEAEQGPPGTLGVPRSEVADLEKKIAMYKAEAVRLQLAAGISSEALDQLSAVVVREMLFRQRKKPDVPVKREDLGKAVANCPAATGKKQASTAAIGAAQFFLASTCGLDMRRLEIGANVATINAKGKFKESGTGRVVFVLRSLLPTARRAVMEWPERLGTNTADALRALRFVIMEMIHLNGGELAEEAMWRHLGHLGVYQEREHPLFGKLDDQITAMVHQRHLIEERSQHPQDGSLVRVFTIGENAVDEIGGDLQSFAEELFAKRKVPTQAQEEDSE